MKGIQMLIGMGAVKQKTTGSEASAGLNKKPNKSYESPKSTKTSSGGLNSGSPDGVLDDTLTPKGKYKV